MGAPEKRDVDRGARRTMVHAFGNDFTPFSEEAFSAQVSKLLAAGSSSSPPGLSRYCPLLRDELARSLLVQDDGVIEESDVFDYSLPCALRHSGLCQHDDADIMPAVEKCDSGLRTHLKPFEPRSLHVLMHRSGAGAESTTFIMRSHLRGANPPLGVVVQGERKPSDESGNFSVHFSLQGGLFAFKKSISLVGWMIKQSKASQVMVLALPQARCEPVVGCGDELVFSPINERAILEGAFVEIHPTQPKVARPRKRKSDLTKGLDACTPAKPRVARRKRMRVTSPQATKVNQTQPTVNQTSPKVL